MKYEGRKGWSQGAQREVGARRAPRLPISDIRWKMAWSARRTVGFAVAGPGFHRASERPAAAEAAQYDRLQNICPKFISNICSIRLPSKYLPQSYSKYLLDTIVFKIFGQRLIQIFVLYDCLQTICQPLIQKFIPVTDQQPWRILKISIFWAQ